MSSADRGGPPRQNRPIDLRLRAAGRGATIIGCEVVSGSEPAAGGPALNVVFPLLPLELWARTVDEAPILDVDRLGVAYEVVAWELGDEVSAPSGLTLREVHAELRPVSTTRDSRLL